MTTYNKEYYQANKSRLMENSKRWRDKNNATYRGTISKWIKEHPEYKMWHCSKQNARRKGIEFTISIEDISIPDTCPYLGVRLTTTFGEGRVQTNVSLDRIDSTKGYIPGNIQVISDLANRMKQDATPEQLVVFALGVLKMYS